MICGALLREHGFDVRLLDGRVQPDWRQTLVKIHHLYTWIVVTSSPLDRWQCPNLEVDEFVRFARSLPPEKVIITGAHGTVYPMEMLGETGARAVIVGEPEQALIDVIRNRWGTAGVAYRDEEGAVCTGRSKPSDLARLPVPAYDLVDWKDYSYELLGSRFGLFEASRGCPHQCRFCFKAMYGRGVRYKPVERLFEEIDRAVRGFRVRSGYIFDLEFSLDRDRAMLICNRFIREGYPFTWCCQTRADAVDADLLKKMKRAGCRLIHFGVESGSERLIESSGKKIRMEQMEKGVRLAGESGMETACFFMFGLPGETEEDRRKTILFSKRLNPTYASFHVATPYPATPLFDGLPYNSNNSKAALFFPSCCAEHDRSILESAARGAFREFYLRPAYIWARARRANIRSWAAMLRLFGGFIG
jgi:radical SAM superfamily enzyme YgiQ (UPF0313 family)